MHVYQNKGVAKLAFHKCKKIQGLDDSEDEEATREYVAATGEGQSEANGLRRGSGEGGPAESTLWATATKS